MYIHNLQVDDVATFGFILYLMNLTNRKALGTYLIVQVKIR